MTRVRFPSPAPILAAALLLTAASASAAPSEAQQIVGKHGLTHASEVLQNDVNNMMHSVVPALVEHMTNDPKSIACGKMVRIDTVVSRMTSHDTWSEIWTYDVCNTEISIPIDFTPDGQGGSYFSAKSEGVKVRPIPAKH